jgi:hypothetical protein
VHSIQFTGPLTVTYDGTAKALGVQTDPPGLNVVVRYNGSTTPPVNAGDYTCSATVEQPGWTGSLTGPLTIEKAAQQITAVEVPDRLLPQGTVTLTAQSSSGRPAVFVLVEGPGTLTVTVAGTQLTATGLGSITLDATLPGDANHHAAPSVRRTIEVGDISPPPRPRVTYYREPGGWVQLGIVGVVLADGHERQVAGRNPG